MHEPSPPSSERAPINLTTCQSRQIDTPFLPVALSLDIDCLPRVYIYILWVNHSVESSARWRRSASLTCHLSFCQPGARANNEQRNDMPMLRLDAPCPIPMPHIPSMDGTHGYLQLCFAAVNWQITVPLYRGIHSPHLKPRGPDVACSKPRAAEPVPLYDFLYFFPLSRRRCNHCRHLHCRPSYGIANRVTASKK